MSENSLSAVSRRELLMGAGGMMLQSGVKERNNRPKRVAGITTVYFHNSHSDMLLSRLLQGENLDFHSRKPELELVSLYVDQFPANDISHKLAKENGVRLCATIEEALTLGGSDLAVDGILLIGEHGSYPQNEKGQDLYPRKRFFDAALAVMRASGRVAPIFSDKHLSHSWTEAKAMTEEANRLKIPLMAGSSVPFTWRHPAVEARRGARMQEAVALSYHTLYGYGFHAMEMLQCLAERRGEGETGVRRVRCIEGPEVWKAGEQGLYDRSLLDAALSALPTPPPTDLKAAVPMPTLFLIEYRDGFRASVFTLNPAIGNWTIAWREENRPKPFATHFWTQEARPFGHFTFLLRAIERMMHTGKPTTPVERTLLTGGMLDFLLTSRLQGGKWIETPELDIRYRPRTDWKDPGPPPPARPIDQQ